MGLATERNSDKRLAYYIESFKAMRGIVVPEIIETVKYALSQGHQNAVFMFAPKLVAELKAARAQRDRIQSLVKGVGRTGRDNGMDQLADAVQRILDTCERH